MRCTSVSRHRMFSNSERLGTAKYGLRDRQLRRNSSYRCKRSRRRTSWRRKYAHRNFGVGNYDAAAYGNGSIRQYRRLHSRGPTTNRRWTVDVHEADRREVDLRCSSVHDGRSSFSWAKRYFHMAIGPSIVHDSDRVRPPLINIPGKGLNQNHYPVLPIEPLCPLIMNLRSLHSLATILDHRGHTRRNATQLALRGRSHRRQQQYWLRSQLG